jgi:hypothetical protein
MKMKKLTILICVLAMLLAFTGIASASPRQPQRFRIKGQTTGFYVDLTQPGPCTAIVWSEGKVIRHIQGTFDMEEYLHFSEDCVTVFQQFMAGDMPTPEYNQGTLKVFPKKGGTVEIGFIGDTDGEAVWGDFWVIYGTDFYEDLEGGGTYEGIPDTCTINPATFELECTGFYADYAFTYWE